MSESSGLWTRLEQALPSYIRKRYVRKFLLVVVIVTALVLVVGLYTQSSVSAELTDTRTQQLRTSTQQTAETMEQWLARQQDTAQMIANHHVTVGGNDIRVGSFITWQRNQMPSVAAIHYVDIANQTIVRSTRSGLTGESLSALNLRWESEGIRRTPDGTVNQRAFYKTQNGTRVAFASRTPSITTGMIVAYDVQSRAKSLRASMDGGYSTVVKRDGTILFAPNGSDVLSTYETGSNASVIEAAANGSVGVENRGDELVGYAPINSTGWIVLEHAPTSTAFALRNTITTELLVLIGVTLAGLLALTLYVRRDIVPAIASISDGATEIAGGNLSVEITDDDRIDEIGQVRDSFRETRSYLETVAEKSDALARQDFDDPVLDEDVPGELGQSLETMREDLQASIQEIEAARERAQASREDAEAMAESLQRQASEFSAVMNQAADGDLTQRLDETVDDEAMAAIATAGNDMLSQLQATLSEVRAFAEDVDGSAQDVAASAQEVQRVSEDVSNSVQEIANGADRQDETVQRASDELTDLSAAIEEVASSADEVAQKSQQAAELGETSREYGSDAIAEMESVESQAEATIDEVEQLDAAMAEIGDIVELIDEIADQTNMLALNASIEAARAGEAGEGFAVVADEIKGLAQETTEATQDIDRRIERIQETTEHVVADMHEVGESVSDGMNAVEDAVGRLEELVEQVEAANTGVQSINDATDDQATTTEEIVAMMDDVGSISEQTAREAESVSAAAEEQTASITEVSEQIQSLSDRSGDLREAISKFDLESARSGAAIESDEIGNHGPTGPDSSAGEEQTASTDGGDRE